MITKDFLTAGHAIFTVTSPKPESPHYTYKVTAPDDQSADSPIWFVSLLTGPDNLSDYSYLGILTGNGTVRTTAKSKFQPSNVDGKVVQSLPVAVAQWAIGQVWHGKTLPAGYDIKHIGKCGVCGRPLTDPVSIDTGIGPVCAGREEEKKQVAGLAFKVGDGATRCVGSDRYPFTIVEIVSAKEIVVQEDTATANVEAGHNHYGKQVYDILPNPAAEREHVTLRKNGRWVLKGDPANGVGFRLGERDKYSDPSF